MKLTYYGSKGHWKGVVVNIFVIMEVDLACISWNITTVTIYHHGKLLLHHPHGVLQLVNFFFCCSCIFICFIDFLKKSLFLDSLSRVVND